MVMIEIYVTCHEYDAALDEIDHLLSLESCYTVNDFKLRRDWQELQEMPRFQKLMQKYALPAGV